MIDFIIQWLTVAALLIAPTLLFEYIIYINDLGIYKRPKRKYIIVLKDYSKETTQIIDNHLRGL